MMLVLFKSNVLFGPKQSKLSDVSEKEREREKGEQEKKNKKK